VVPPALREELKRAEQDGEYAARRRRHHVHGHSTRGCRTRRGDGPAVLEALATTRSEGVLQRVRSEQRDGDCRRYAVLGDGGLSSARDRREDRQSDLGQSPGGLQEG